MSTVRDYFAREAGDYLDSLDRTVDGLDHGAVAPTELHRLARALRGSAQMAREDGITQVGTALEAVARAVAESQVGWSPDLSGRVRQTLQDVRALLTAEPASAATTVNGALARLAGVAPAASRAPAPGVADADGQFQAFAARESAAVLATIESALQGIGANAMDREPLKAVLRRQRALMGAARLPSIPLLAEALTAVDEVTRLVARLDVPVKDEWLDAYRAAHDVLAALVAALQHGTEPTPGDALARLRTLRRELMDRHGGEEPMRQPPVLTPQDAASGGAPPPPPPPPPAASSRALPYGAPASAPPAAGAPARPPAAAPARPPAAAPARPPAAGPVSASPTSAAPAASPAPAVARPGPGAPPGAGVVASAASAASGEARPVEEFFYRGERALGRALELRPELERALVAGEPRARELLAEVFDLIALARA